LEKTITSQPNPGTWIDPSWAVPAPLAGEEGESHLTTDEVRIRDLSRSGITEWTPPIGAMGGPPAHELYRDLVAHGGLRLFRDEAGNPWVEMQDGERRRSFPVPGVALRGALDRFRMRRNLRPVPETDLEDFARVVTSRISDPDVRLPLIAPTTVEEGDPAAELRPSMVSPAEPAPLGSRLEAELAAVLQEVEAVRTHAPSGPPRPDTPPVWDEDAIEPPVLRRMAESLDVSISGGRRTSDARDLGLPRYLRVLRGLVRNGGWLGTLGELGQMTGEAPDAVFSSLLKYHSEFTGNNLVVAPVELEDGWRWLVVDRSRLQSSPLPPTDTPDSGTP
jgi:hypothetical protein